MDIEQAPAPGRKRFLRPRVLIGAAAVVLLLCAGLALGGNALFDRLTEPGDPKVGVTEVSVNDFDFSPNSIQIEPGTTVTWTWTGKEDHDVNGDGLESPVQKTGTYQYTFEKPGQYDYECTLHPIMRGRVIVTDDTSTAHAGDAA